MGNASDTHEEIRREWSQFMASWLECQAAWKDEVAIQFQARFIGPWQDECHSFFACLDALELELATARRELG